MFAPLAETTVQEIVRQEPVVVAQDATLDETISAMAEAGRGSALVGSPSGELLGIFTERDLATRVNLADAEWGTQPVAEFMTRKLITVKHDTSLAVALKLMRAHSIRSLPVVTGREPTALLSVRDILRHIAECFPDDFVNLPPDSSLEATSMWGG
jgi:CBS domain-containing protein